MPFPSRSLAEHSLVAESNRLADVNRRFDRMMATSFMGGRLERRKSTIHWTLSLPRSCRVGDVAAVLISSLELRRWLAEFRKRATHGHVDGLLVVRRRRWHGPSRPRVCLGPPRLTSCIIMMLCLRHHFLLLPLTPLSQICDQSNAEHQGHADTKAYAHA